MRKASQFAAMLSFSLTLSAANAQIQVTNERAVNTLNAEIYPSFYKKGVSFQSSVQITAKGNLGEPSLVATSILLSQYQADGRLEKPTRILDDMASPFLSGSLVFEASGKMLFFTQANLTKKGKPKTGKDGNVHLKIYTAKLNQSNQKWEDITELPFCTDDFDTAYPSVSADGKHLFFSSNRPGGKGGMDLYVSIKINDKWSDPVNLGPKINTAQDEVFPFLHPDRSLFFSSQGHGSRGKLDIFVSRKTDEGWYKPVALPEPINSSDDDMGIIVYDDMRGGYFVSTRKESIGGEDIFGFNAPTEIIDFSKETIADISTETETEKKPSTQTVIPPQTTIPNTQNPQPTTMAIEKPKVKIEEPRKIELPIAETRAVNAPTQAVQPTAVIDEKPAAKILDPLLAPPSVPEPYNVVERGDKVKKPTRQNPNSPLTINNLEKNAQADDGFEEPRLKRGVAYLFEIKEMVIGTHIELKYQYGYGASDLDEALKDELSPIIAWLKDRPNVSVEIGSHTDSRGKAAFNEMLSQLRADNIRTYLVGEGIALNRILSKGYGESHLKNGCRDGNTCPDDEHAINRRIEIKILKMTN